MARHVLTNLTVENGADVIDGVREMRITENVPEVDLTAAGDAAGVFGVGITRWTGSISLLLDWDSAANQALRAGDTIAFEGYTEGNSSGKTMISGSAFVIDQEIGGAYESEGARSWSLRGNGALTISTVA